MRLTRVGGWDARFRNWLLLAAAVGMVVPLWMGAVVRLGRHIPQDELTRDYFTAFVWAVALGVLLLFVPLRREDRGPLLLLWLAKIGVALGFELVYEAQYNILDAYFYFEEAQLVELSSRQLALADGTRNIINLTWWHQQLLGDSFHALKVTWAMIGLWAVYLFYRAFVRFLGHEEPRLLLVLGFFPSILFWSSTFGKDPLVLFGIALYTWGLVSWQRTHRPRHMVALIAGLLFGALFRLWLIPILLAPLFALLVLRTRRPRTRVLMIGTATLVLLLAAKLMLLKLGFEDLQQLLKAYSIISEAATAGGSAQKLPTDLTSPADLLLFLPLGMFTALFRPLPGDVMNAFGLLAGLENLLLVVLCGIAVRRTRWSELRRHPLLIAAIVLLISWSGFYAFVSSFNLGGAARFKLQVLPIMLGLLLFFARARATSSSPSAVAPHAAV